MHMYMYIYILKNYIYIIYIIKYIYTFIHENIVKETDNLPCRLLTMHQGPHITHASSVIMSPSARVIHMCIHIYIYIYIYR